MGRVGGASAPKCSAVPLRLFLFSCCHLRLDLPQGFQAGQLLFKEPPLAAIQHSDNRAGGRRQLLQGLLLQARPSVPE